MAISSGVYSTLGIGSPLKIHRIKNYINTRISASSRYTCKNDSPYIVLCDRFLLLNLLFVMVGNISKVLPSGSVNLVGESWMVRVQLGTVRQNLVCESIQVPDAPRKPWDRSQIVLVIPASKNKTMSLKFIAQGFFIDYLQKSISLELSTLILSKNNCTGREEFRQPQPGRHQVRTPP